MSCAIVNAKLVDGEAVYGHYVGRVAPGTHFAHLRAPFIRHGWILLKDGRVLDPTRWVFEGVEPYLYLGDTTDYDEGGERMRELMFAGKAIPRPEGQLKRVDIDDTLETWLADTLAVKDARYLAANQLFWLANMPYTRLHREVGPDGVRKIYDIIATYTDTSIVWIPTDNANRARRECGFTYE